MLEFIKFLNCTEDQRTMEYPKVKTKHSACADLEACFHKNVKCYSSYNDIMRIEICGDDFLRMMPGDRAMIPTGWRVMIPHGYKMCIYPRSGLSLKKGITLVNTPGIVDSDYTDELMVLLHNTSQVPVKIKNGEAICQMEIVPSWMQGVRFTPCTEEEIQKHKETSNRNGGFGSTDKS